MRPTDHGVLGALRSDIGLQHILLANPPPGGDPDVAGWIVRRERDGALWCVASRETDDCLGYVQLASIHHKNRFAWLGIAIAPAARGGGAGRDAMTALFAEAEALDLRKLLLEVRADNASAIAFHDALGFRRVGMLRAHYDDGKQLHDVLVMERPLAGKTSA